MTSMKIKSAAAALAALALGVSLFNAIPSAAAASGPPGVTLTAADAATGSTTETSAGGTINYVASMSGTGPLTLTDTIPSGQTLNTSSVKAPTGWNVTATPNSLTVTGDTTNAGVFTGDSSTVALSSVQTTRTGGDGWVPVPYKDSVWGAYHYTMDGGFGGGSPVLWAADKATGAITSYQTGLGTRFLTPWFADPVRVGSKLYIPGFLFASTPSIGQTPSAQVGFACFDLDTRAGCTTNWYRIDDVARVNLVQGKAASVVEAQPLMRMAALGLAQDGTYRMTVHRENPQQNPILDSISFASGAPVLMAAGRMNIPTMRMQSLTADGRHIYSMQQNDRTLYCTDTTTAGACTGWPNPSVLVSASASSRIIVVDVLGVVCVQDDSRTPAYGVTCYDQTTGAPSSVNWTPSAQSVAGPQYRFDSTGTRQYLLPGYTNSTNILCLDKNTGTPCAGFGTNGYATMAGVGSTDYKGYGVSPDDVLPNCMWGIGDSGYLYPFDASTGAAGCRGTQATVPVFIDPSQWCDNASGHVRGFTTLAFEGTAPTGNVHVRVLRDGQAVSGWEDRSMAAASSLDISAVPYTSGANYEFHVWFDSSPAATPRVTVNVDQDGPQVCFSTVVADDCAVASPATNTVNLAVGAGLGATNVTSNQTSLTVKTDPTVCAATPSISIVKSINGDDANSVPGVEVGGGSTMAVTYLVKNDGDVALTNVTVTDDKIAASDISCPKTDLAVNEEMTCTASLAAPAAGVQHTNTGTVVGTPVTGGGNVTDNDPANAHVKAASGISIVKSINGDDANAAPGVEVAQGSTMAITYLVKNEGNVALTGVTVTDDKIAASDISCPKTDLAAGESMTCTASLAAPAAGVQHTNTGTVEGTDPSGTKVSDNDPANANVKAVSGITIVKSINGDDANEAPGVTVGEGSTMAITYVVTNTGNVTLNNVTVTDDKIAASDISCPKATLGAGESMTCTASLAAPAVGVQHTNTGTVEGTDPSRTQVTDNDPANANVTPAPSISIVKSINGDDANSVPGVKVDGGSTMAITYVVTNTGNTILSNVTVTDDKIANAGISCPKTTLAVNESMTCTASLAAPAAGVQHTNTGTVVGTPVDEAGTVLGENVTDNDPANAHVAPVPSISIVKSINGDDANEAPGVKVEAGSTMKITYLVTNTGNVTLNNVTVTDDKIAASGISCPKATLGAGESMTCTASLAAPAAGVQHTNVGTVVGTPVTGGGNVSDNDPATAHVDAAPAISIVKSINGDDANEAPGVEVEAGSTMKITYLVKNEGNVDLTDVTVTDDKIAAEDIDCLKDTLSVGESMTCTASHAAPGAGRPHHNMGSVEGTPVTGGEKVTDEDPANAHVVPAPTISIVKSINGDDANEAPGVKVEAGSTMKITYLVTNTGNIGLRDVVVTDDKVPADSITCPKDNLYIGEAMTCTASLAAPAVGVQHTNTGTVVAQPTNDDFIPVGEKVTDNDPANAHVVPAPSISIVKSINGDDANEAPGVKVEAGSTMKITYVVTNTGNTILSNVTVTDDKIANAGISCPKTTLAAGESMTCTASLAAPAAGVQHTNTGTVVGTPVDEAGTVLGENVTDNDPANAHVAPVPSISIVKSINGDDANEAPGVKVEAGSTMKITYLVTNTGNVTLNNVTVTDDKIAASGISCPKATLGAGESMTCTASLAAPAAGVQHTNVGTVVGTPVTGGGNVSDNDPATAHVDAAPAISIVKSINGDDANEAPGVEVEAGSTMKITYLVKNEGNVDLTDVTVTDDKIAAEDIDCLKDTLSVGESMTCTASHAAPGAGRPHHNMGSVEGTPVTGGEKVTDEDPANAHVVPAPTISIVKSINGDDANEAPGVKVEAGSTMKITYLVTNTGNIGLRDVVVTDDKVPADSITCPKDNLYIGEAMTCTASLAAPAVGVQHTNTGTVVAQPTNDDFIPVGEKVTDNDPANAHVVPAPSISIVKSINGDDANEAPGVKVEAGSTMKITYVVTNTGNTILSNVTVTDDKIANAGISCPKTTLAAGESMTCTASLAAPAAGVQHTNTGTVVGTPVGEAGTVLGENVTDRDPANAHVMVDLVKRITSGDPSLAWPVLGFTLMALALSLAGLLVWRRRHAE